VWSKMGIARYVQSQTWSCGIREVSLTSELGLDWDGCNQYQGICNYEAIASHGDRVSAGSRRCKGCGKEVLGTVLGI
jgi:heterodisulfide reductase subunit A-like polyferredoxin